MSSIIPFVSRTVSTKAVGIAIEGILGVLMVSSLLVEELADSWFELHFELHC